MSNRIIQAALVACVLAICGCAGPRVAKRTGPDPDCLLEDVFYSPFESPAPRRSPSSNEGEVEMPLVCRVALSSDAQIAAQAAREARERADRASMALDRGRQTATPFELDELYAQAIARWEEYASLLRISGLREDKDATRRSRILGLATETGRTAARLRAQRSAFRRSRNDVESWPESQGMTVEQFYLFLDETLKINPLNARDHGPMLQSLHTASSEQLEQLEGLISRRLREVGVDRARDDLEEAFRKCD